MDTPVALRRTLGPWLLWGLGVGYVISGEYFGWNLGLPEAGPIGMLIATLVATLMYVAFVLTYAELACALPQAGGAFVYARRAFGPALGHLAGMAQLAELVFAPPAIAAAIGAYLHVFLPEFTAVQIATVAYLVFTALNVLGVRHSATFELAITVVAVVELLIFCGLTAPSFSWSAFSQDALPNGIYGVFAALPFAIWFYLGIEGLANVAEEARDPQRDLARGFGWAMTTLVVLALGTFFCAVGVDGWRTVVYPPGSDVPSDSPLPLAMGHAIGTDSPFYRLLVSVGLFGLVASFHGIILAAGRATLEMGRQGFAPPFVGRIHPGRGTPAAALLVNTAVGLVALHSGRTAEIIVLSVMGALTMYALAAAAQLVLRRREPELPRPFRTPVSPVLPITALVLALVCLFAVVWFNPGLAALYAGLLGLGYGWYFLWVRPRSLSASAP